MDDDTFSAEFTALQAFMADRNWSPADALTVLSSALGCVVSSAENPNEANQAVVETMACAVHVTNSTGQTKH